MLDIAQVRTGVIILSGIFIGSPVLAGYAWLSGLFGMLFTLATAAPRPLSMLPEGPTDPANGPQADEWPALYAGAGIADAVYAGMVGHAYLPRRLREMPSWATVSMLSPSRWGGLASCLPLSRLGKSPAPANAVPSSWQRISYRHVASLMHAWFQIGCSLNRCVASGDGHVLASH